MIFGLFSSPVCLPMYWYCKEKFHVDHSWESKGYILFPLYVSWINLHVTLYTICPIIFQMIFIIVMLNRSLFLQYYYKNINSFACILCHFYLLVFCILLPGMCMCLSMISDPATNKPLLSAGYENGQLVVWDIMAGKMLSRNLTHSESGYLIINVGSLLLLK